MKRLFFIATVLLSALLFGSATESFSQTPEPGSLEFIKNFKTVKVIVDYSKAIIDNMDYETRCEADEAWVKGEKEVTSRFISALSRVLSSHSLIVSKGSELQLVVKINKIDEDGECYGTVEFQGKDGELLGTLGSVNGNGGKWGSLTNLAGDGMERLAEDIGSKLEDYNRATKKATKKAAKASKK